MPTITTKTTQRAQPSTTSLVRVKTHPLLQISPETVVSNKQTSTSFSVAIRTTETSPIVAVKQTSTSYYDTITTTEKSPRIADKQTSTSFNAAVYKYRNSHESKNSSASCPRYDDTICPDNWEPLDDSSCYTIENVKSSTEFFNVKNRCILSGGSLINLEALETLKKIVICKQNKKERTHVLILDDNQLCEVVNLDTFQQHKVTCYKNSIAFVAICAMNITKNRIASIGQSKDKISTSENVSIKVGLGVGIPVLVIIVLAVLIYINRETLIHLPRPRNRELNPERSRHYINVQLCAVPPIHQITRNEVWGQYDEVEGEYENLKTPGRYLSDQGLVYLTLAQVRPTSLPNHVTPVTRYEPVEYAALDFNLTGAMASEAGDTRVYENGGPADQDQRRN
ncbi:uncharacterized protein LOC131958360 [Physella acuta]|uniref:uncharacterized protein LOC131958360 n=1 Tax=Physella acuta TaxID=109671 RepID=UPI0027DCC02A|nr:uncharacterized protein LOC131958360 [Physella acuta]